MSAKAIREFNGKTLVSKYLSQFLTEVEKASESYEVEDRCLLITSEMVNPADPLSFQKVADENPWVLSTNLVAKPDQLIKRRGKAGLLAVNKTWSEVVEWICSRINKEVKIEVISGVLDTFIVEPFVPHEQVYLMRKLLLHQFAIITFSFKRVKHTCFSLGICILQSDEYYICIQSFRCNDELLFTHEGGVDIGDVDAKV